MAKLKTRVSSLDEVAENFREAYVEGDNGMFTLDTEPVGTFELIDSKEIRGKLENVRGRANKLQSQLGELDKYKGIDDPNEALKALDLMKSGKLKEGDFQKELESRVSQVVDQHNSEKEALTAENQSLKGSLKKNLIRSVAMESIAKRKGNPKLLMPHVEMASDVVKGENGQYEVAVLKPDGSIAVDGSGNNLSVDELVKGFESDFPEAFKGAQSSGSGGGSAGGKKTAAGDRTMNRSDFEGLSQSARKEFTSNGGRLVD